ncbi:hypothetical protein TNCV_4629351 [Trichonephila clavipes]|nr:hypothetical protein TNCV_4629351 [Trichonephila clavipes]
MQTRSYAIFQSRLLFENYTTPLSDEIGNAIEEIVHFARQRNLKVDCDNIQELLYFHNHEVMMDEFIEMQEQDIGELCRASSIRRSNNGW